MLSLQFHIFIFFVTLFSVSNERRIKLKRTNKAHGSMKELTDRDGYDLQGHILETPDHYILGTFRIPHGKNSTGVNDIPMLIAHGTGGCSENFILYRNKSFAYYFADRGYDVWMLNYRGNRHSRKHKYLNPDTDKEFWDFDLEELSYYDIPTNIDYILNVTKKEKLVLVGYSQGTTLSFITLIEKPEYNEKIIASVHLAPSVFRTNFKKTFPLLNSIVQTYKVMEEVLNSLNIYEIFPNNAQINNLVSKLTHIKELKPLFIQIAHLIGGSNSGIFDESVIEDVTKVMPAGSSRKSLIHYFQQMSTGEFRQFNYGPEGNLKKYNSTEAPLYDIKKVTCPVLLLYSSTDWLSENEMDQLEKELVNLYWSYEVPYEGFNHVDFVFSKKVIPLVFEPLYNKLKELISS